MSHNVNAIVERYDATVGASTLNCDTQEWIGLHRRFLVEEIARISTLAETGNNAALEWRQFEELVETRGFAQEKVDFRRRGEIFKDIPDRVGISLQRFATYMGDESKLENWQKLCRDLSFEVIPTSVNQCRMAVKKVFVNIYIFLDSVEAARPPPPIHRFGSLKALARWSKKNGKIFPKKVAKEEGALAALLQPIIRGRSGGRSRGKKKGGNTGGLADAMGGLHLR